MEIIMSFSENIKLAVAHKYSFDIVPYDLANSQYMYFRCPHSRSGTYICVMYCGRNKN